MSSGYPPSTARITGERGLGGGADGLQRDRPGCSRDCPPRVISTVTQRADGIGDWTLPDFKAACTFAVSQGWLIVEDDTLTLTTAGLAAA